MAREPAREKVERIVHPSSEHIAVAKEAIISLLCAQGAAETSALTSQVLEANGQNPVAARDPRTLQAIDPWEQQAEHVRSIAAARMALSELQGEALALPMGGSLNGQGALYVTIRTAHGSHGESFDDYNLLLAQSYRASSNALSLDGKGFVLHDPDLYLRRVGTRGMHERVATSLTEAVGCYRRGLYLGAAVLIGSASEGAWMELVRAVGNVLDKLPSVLDKELAKATPSIKVVQEHTRDTILAQFESAMKKANVRKGDLEQVMDTAGYYRRLRNYAIHFSFEDLARLNHATVGILLLNAADYFSILYRLRNAIDPEAASP